MTAGRRNPQQSSSPEARALVDGSRTPGVYRVLGDQADIASTLRQAGWVTAVVPPTSSPEAFYAALAAGLGLPGYFGANLDALWDVLTDLERPTALVLAEWSTFARARPERWERILAVLSERTEQDPAFAVLLT